MRRWVFALALAGLPAVGALAAMPSGGPGPGPAAAATNDYPTATRADYVFACMASNGGTQQALRQCSCAIDVIATILPYHDYVEAETVLRMRQTPGGYLAETFRGSRANGFVRQLHGAQAEADVRCF